MRHSHDLRSCPPRSLRLKAFLRQKMTRCTRSSLHLPFICLAISFPNAQHVCANMRPLKVVLLTLIGILIAAVLLLTLTVHHGFRASTTPAAWEAHIARTIRNAAIPSHESQLKNPVSQDPPALQQGRDTFLTRCSICHGTDGGGRTPVGTNLYPRVPDLRSSATQNLSDGDLHYIIENGVQLTGMPAGVAHHGASADDSWPLV